jgi:hypothetical protein
LNKQLSEVRQRILSHMRETGGKIVLWGPVYRYYYYYSEDKALIFSNEAEIVGESWGSVPDKATVTCQGKPLF